jgi:hypothetical protein
LKATIQELSLRVPSFSITYLSLSEKLLHDFLTIRADYLVKIKNWSQKYPKTDLNDVDVESIKKQVDELL